MRQKDNRPNSGKRGYDGAWKRLRSKKVKANPFCERCLNIGKYVPIAQKTDGNYGVVHHIKPIETHPELRLSWDNLESLCFDCHEVEHGRKSYPGCDKDGFPLDPSHHWNKRG